MKNVKKGGLFQVLVLPVADKKKFAETTAHFEAEK